MAGTYQYIEKFGPHKCPSYGNADRMAGTYEYYLEKFGRCSSYGNADRMAGTYQYYEKKGAALNPFVCKSKTNGEEEDQ